MSGKLYLDTQGCQAGPDATLSMRPNRIEVADSATTREDPLLAGGGHSRLRDIPCVTRRAARG